MSPRLSVIVPVHAQWELLPGLLAALAAQTLDRAAFEVIVVDNDASAPVPGDDIPPAVPGGAAAAPPGRALLPEVRRVPCPAPGSYAARNAGAAAARGDWLVFTDADCLPAPGWLEGLDAAAAATPGALLAGPVRMLPPAHPNAYARYDLIRGIPQARYLARGYAATANLAIPRPVFEALGGFDAARRSGGDAELCRRAGRAGHPLRLVAAAEVGHPCRGDWAALKRKARRIKGGQIAAGPLPRRLAWLLRTLAPPLADTRAYLAAPHPLRHRLTAVAVRFRLWGVELAETARLLLGGEPERR